MLPCYSFTVYLESVLPLQNGLDKKQTVALHFMDLDQYEKDYDSDKHPLISFDPDTGKLFTVVRREIEERDRKLSPQYRHLVAKFPMACLNTRPYAPRLIDTRKCLLFSCVVCSSEPQ